MLHIWNICPNLGKYSIYEAFGIVMLVFGGLEFCLPKILQLQKVTTVVAYSSVVRGAFASDGSTFASHG